MVIDNKVKRFRSILQIYVLPDCTKVVSVVKDTRGLDTRRNDVVGLQWLQIGHRSDLRSAVRYDKV